MSGVQMKYPILSVPTDALTKYKSTDGWKNFTEIKGFYPTMSGKCGDDIEWILEYNTLTISGKGAIYDYNSSNNKAPWYDYRTVIENVIIDHGITEIGSYTFYNCEKLANIAMPSSLTDIGSYVFGYCDFTRIDIPDCVNSIGDNAFQSCYKATSVHIPGSVTNIGNNVFKGCENIESIIVDEDNATYDSREECNAIIETVTNTLVVGCKNSAIPNSITSIGVSAFEGCTGLLKIEIPRSVTEIGNRAFYNCRNLSDMTIPSGVKSIGTYAFYNCRALPDVTIPGSTTKIEDYAFYNCIGLTSITISGKETSVGNYVFSNCNAIKEIYSKSKIPVTIQYSTFTNYTATLYVPIGAKAAYKAADYWKNFGNIVEMDFTVAGDVDGDDTVDVADVTAIVEVILAGTEDVSKQQTFDDWTSTNTGTHSSTSQGSYTLEATEGGVLTFDWSVSSENNYDWLIITIDGTQILKKSGSNSGSYTHTFSTAGTHTLVVKYTKDGSASSGSDQGSIYNIILSDDASNKANRADIDNDGSLDVADITALVDIILRGE